MTKTLPSLTTRLLIIAAIAVSLLLHIYRFNSLPLNEDEVAQGFNTYSVLQTGYDEYGRLPLRYLSFGENKLPFVGMLSTPFIALMGLNEMSVRLPTLLIGVLFPALFFSCTFAITRSKSVALYACILASTNVWLHTMSRHQHESVVVVAITLLFVTTLLPSDGRFTGKSVFKLSMLALAGLFTYHTSKIIIPYLLVSALIFVWIHHRRWFRLMLILFITVLLLFVGSELTQPTNRVGELSYFTSRVFTHEIEDGRRNGGSALYYNKLVYGTHQMAKRLSAYVSPQFLLITSDTNQRFGAPYVPLLTVVEYLLAIVGLVFVWWKKMPLRFFLTGLVLVSILPAALALPEDSASRSFSLIVPLIIFASFGAEHILKYLRNVKKPLIFVGTGIITLNFVFHIVQTSYTWKQYFTRYLSDPLTERSWQFGSMEMADYVWKHYDTFDRFVITSMYGQPYIYLLFKKPYDPHSYQIISKQGTYNEYGFWEQSGFDKFIFQKPVRIDSDMKSIAYIMTPEEVRDNNLDKHTLIPIAPGHTPRFYVLEKH